MECFKYLGNVVSNNAIFTRATKSSIDLVKATFDRKEIHLITKLDLNLRNKLLKCNFYSTAFYGAETWTFQKVDKKYLESFKI